MNPELLAFIFFIHQHAEFFMFSFALLAILGLTNNPNDLDLLEKVS